MIVADASITVIAVIVGFYYYYCGGFDACRPTRS